jgi:hypothetical protein
MEPTFPNLGLELPRETDGSQKPEPMLPNRRTSGSEDEELMIPNVGPMLPAGSQFEELLVSKRWNQYFPILGAHVPSSRN